MDSNLYSTTGYKIWKKTLFGKPKSYDITVDTQRGNKINKENQRDKKNRLKLIEATQAEKCNGEKNI